MGRERAHLMLCQVIFVTVFLFRVCMLLIEEQGRCVDFQHDCQLATWTRMIPLQYAIYDVIPSLTIISLHWVNFRTSPRQDTHPVKYDSDESSTSSLQVSCSVLPDAKQHERHSQQLLALTGDANAFAVLGGFPKDSRTPPLVLSSTLDASKVFLNFSKTSPVPSYSN